MLGGLNGDSRQHARLLNAIRPLLASFFSRRLGGRTSETEDLVQDVLLVVHERRSTYDASRPFTPWLFAVARYKLIDHYRRARTHEPIDSVESLLGSDCFDEAVNAGLDVNAMLATLPTKQALSIRLLRLQGLSVAEAARAAKLGESDIKVSAHRGIKSLARRFAQFPAARLAGQPMVAARA